MASHRTSTTELSYDTKTILVVLLLVTVYPVGLVLMFVWMKWPLWLKLMIAIPVALILLVIFSMFIIIFAALRSPVNEVPSVPTYSLGECIRQCSTYMDSDKCAIECLVEGG